MARAGGRTGLALAALAVAVGMSAAAAQAKEMRKIGNWLITAERDRFAEKAVDISALVMRGSAGFGVRCIGGRLSLGLVEIDRADLFKQGAEIVVRYRADDGPIASGIGQAISPSLVEIAADRVQIERLQGAGEIAVRVETALLRYDLVFAAGGSKSALAMVLRQCPAGQPK